MTRGLQGLTAKPASTAPVQPDQARGLRGLDRAKRDRLDDVSPRAGGSTRPIQHGARRGGPRVATTFRAFAVAMRLDSSACPVRAQDRMRGLVTVLRATGAGGTNHVTLNLATSGRAPREVIEELAAEVLSAFHAHSSGRDTRLG